MKKSVRLKLHTILSIFTSCIVITLIAILGRLTLSLFTSRTIESFAASRQDTLLQINESVTAYCNKIELLSKSYADISYIKEQAALKKGQIDVESFQQQIAEIKTEIDESFFFPEIAYDLQVVYDNGLVFSSQEEYLDTLKMIPDTLWFYRAKKQQVDTLWQSNIVFKDGDEKTNVISLVKFIKDENGMTNGALLINLNERQLFQIYSQIIGFQSTIYLVDSNGQIASHPMLSLVGRFFYDMNIFNNFFEDRNWAQITKSGEEYLFSKFSSNNNPWIVVEEVPISVITDPLNDVSQTIEVIAGLLLFLSLILVIWFSRKVSSPFERLSKSMEKAGKGDLSIIFDQEGSYESSNMAQSSQNFVTRIKTLVEDLKETERKKRSSELEFLQMQINPHFIYNTLFNIRCMVEIGLQEQASEMLDRFSSMLKKVLKIETSMISIIDNIDFLEDYTVILKQRYGSLSLDYEIQEGVEKEKILKFILQPLVENSIYHGFPDGLSPQSHIKLTFTRLGTEFLEIHVIDNGCGMSEERISDIMNDSVISDGSHIGLLNVITKLQLYYEGDAKLIIHSKEHEGTDIKIIVPIQGGQNNENLDS